MPGIAGCVRVSGERALPTGFPDVLTGLLSCEPGYATHPIVSAPAAQAVVFSPQLSFAVAGAATDEQSGISAGYYGEFFGPEFRVDAPSATARRLIELYREKGAALPASLDGTFVVFIHDPSAGEALLFNDHYASRPLCYAEQGGLLYFSPEPKGIAGLPGISVDTDEAALLMILNHGHLVSGATYYRQIRYLAPGSTLRVRRGAVQLTRHFEYLVNEQNEGAAAGELLDGLAAAMRQAIRKRLSHGKDFVIPISGGYDSRGILAIVAELTGGRPKTVSWGTDEKTEDADAYIGREVARFYGAEHHFIPRDFQSSVGDIEEMVARVDGGSVDAVMHPNELKLMRQIKRELSADYLLRGDEIFGFKGEARSDAEALARVGLRDLDEFPDVVRLLRPARKAEFQAMAREATEEALAACPLRQPNPRKDYLHYYQKIRNFANRSNYYKLTVLEAANPWLDKDVVEFLRALPASCRIEKELYRRTLAARFPDLMKVPIARRNSLEDYGALMREPGPLQKFIRYHLLERRNRFHDMMDPEPLRSMVNAVLQGQRSQSAKVSLYMKAKGMLRTVSPKLYEVVRSRAQGHGVIAAVAPEWIVFRLLLMKLACDRLP